ncbi:MAG: segregation/condensation protein A [Desulfobacterales bacterium]|jgi:segregation and condensation protein A
MPEEPYKVHLENIFEGPMDLLVHLIKKNELDIYDIPIALITDQYLQYLEWMKMMNINFAGEFIVMAATLAQIKSRMLLPIHPEDDQEDPRLEITQPLIEYMQMKSAAEQLTERQLLGENIFVRGSQREDILAASQDEYIKIGLFELIDAFQKILESMPSDDRMEFSADRISVKDRISQIADILESKGSTTFEELFSEHPNKSDLIITFLAILEMVKLALIRIVQHVQSGAIRLFYL